MDNVPPRMDRQYSQKETHDEYEQLNEDDPFESTLVREGTRATPTRLQTIRQLEEEKQQLQEVLLLSASDRQACLRRVAALETHIKSLSASGRLDGGGRKSRRKKGGRKSRRKRGGRKSRRRNTKKRKTNRKKRKTNRRKRKTKRRR